mmetsp:Transcript_52683/g.125872  ORF Transcript_52683/g.125872 Transcript_52683/m.125872 type:complete len:209 (+) Transcript_52683:73-699(+)|eukprot:CAMPEP_0178402622 /NCGR_PEP_ID=MMETSP0689_2-20121128/16938_1 /TAXON_ID=160604 /ORGANISM="Amphidinium massartii, Strain CS-259" /LENGTH=208 /DNA_ID=CAMNT_0020023531 /DNA_START=70 /DNA_END=696 /DNA_ORIENTATION=-
MASPDIVLRYLALPHPIQGRGGALRCFLLAHKIKFTEQLYSFEEWGAAKAGLSEEAVKHVPFLEVDGKKYTEHIALMKMAANLAKVPLPTDPLALYAQDGIADAYAEWRGAWAKAKFSGEEGAADAYKKDLPNLLKEFETLVKKYSTGEPFICGSTPYWADTALFSIMSDNITTEFLTEDMLKEYPRLLAIYTSYKGIKEVAEWHAKK